MPGQEQASFSLSSAYIIGGNTNRNVLTGFLAVDSETSPGTGKKGQRSASYGKLRLLELPRSSNVSGPGQVQNIFDSNPAASTTLNLLSQQGSQVIKGNLLTLPGGRRPAHVQPVYVQSSSGISTRCCARCWSPSVTRSVSPTPSRGRSTRSSAATPGRRGGTGRQR